MSEHTFKRVKTDEVESGDIVKMKGAGGHGPPAGDYTVSSWPPSDDGHFSGYGGTAGRRSMRTLHEDLILSARRLVPKKAVEEPPTDKPTEPVEVKPDNVVAAAKATTKPAVKAKTTAKKRSTSGKTTRKA